MVLLEIHAENCSLLFPYLFHPNYSSFFILDSSLGPINYSWLRNKRIITSNYVLGFMDFELKCCSFFWLPLCFSPKKVWCKIITNCLRFQEPVKSAVIDSCIRVTDNGRESIHRKVWTLLKRIYLAVIQLFVYASCFCIHSVCNNQLLIHFSGLILIHSV